MDVPVSYEEALDLLEEGVEEVANEEGSPIQIAIKYDMGWQKRSSGRRYDSLSGVGSVIGNESGKVIGYGVRIKDCRLCTLHVRKGEIPPSHECHKNFDGTSKAMEGDLGKEIVRDLESKGAEVATLIMDDDSTTAAHIRNSVPHKITKLSDFMHVKKHIVGELYKLQKKHKVLSSEIIKYLSKCFSFAVRTSKDNADGVRQNLLCIVPHAFGCHDNCGAWCGYAKDPASYRHKSLPGGKDLAGDSLKRDLEHIFTRAAQNADKFAPCASTSENESFNNIVCSKAPKSRHYSSSGSLSTRVEAAVAQKNLGLSYISKVHEAANISPGQFYKRHAQISERKRKHVKDFKSTLKYKRRRLAFGKTKSVLETAAEVREGKTYLSGVDSEATTVDDIETIPPAVAAPDYHSISVDNVSMVYFDLETTSFHKTCDIVQLAACCGEETFSNYVLPNQAIDSRASEVTGISIISGELYSHGQRVESVTLSTCLINFVKWLEPFAPVILVAHNCRTFDSYRLVRSICGADMLYDFQNIVNGFADTLPLFKAVFQGLSSYKQEHLVQHVLQTDYSAHNALHDAVSLKDMMHNKTYPIEVDLLSKYSFSVKAVEQQIVRDTEQEKHLDSLQRLLSSHACGVAMTRKIAASGLGMNHLKLAFSRGGVDAVHALFSDRDENGKVRVSLSRRVANNISKILSWWVNIVLCISWIDCTGWHIDFNSLTPGGFDWN